jgi:hypothetical protein
MWCFQTSACNTSGIPGVVIVPDILVLHHVVQVADDFGRLQNRTAGRDQRLVHVQGNCESAPYSAELG